MSDVTLARLPLALVSVMTATTVSNFISSRVKASYENWKSWSVLAQKEIVFLSPSFQSQRKLSSLHRSGGLSENSCFPGIPSITRLCDLQVHPTNLFVNHLLCKYSKLFSLSKEQKRPSRVGPGLRRWTRRRGTPKARLHRRNRCRLLPAHARQVFCQGSGQVIG